MAHIIIYSRVFLEKTYSFNTTTKDLVLAAAEHTAEDPTLNDYSRAYLTPYKQKHPTTNHQYTLYFEIFDQITSIYFSWVNDDSCLHTTRANYDDPCLKEFDRLRNSGNLEKYDPKYHHTIFEVQPDKKKPIRCRSRYLGYEVTLNTMVDSNGHFSAHSFYCSEEHSEISKIHITQFLTQLHTFITNGTLNFEFRIYKNGNQEQIQQLNENYDHNEWRIISDPDDFVMVKV